MEYKIDGVKVTSALEDLSEDEVRKYIRYVKENAECKDPLEEIKIVLCDDGKIDVEYIMHGEKFERVRRITGYLTGDLTTWNNAKRAEESERVKHNFRGLNYE